MMDLQPDRSLVRRLLEQGLDVYLIDWGNPDGADRLLELDDYINGYIDRCVRHVLARARHPQARTCSASARAAPSASATPRCTPSACAISSRWSRRWISTRRTTCCRAGCSGLDVDALVEAFGIVPGEVLNAAYVALMPFRLLQQKYVHLLDGARTRRRWRISCAWRSGSSTARARRARPSASSRAGFFQENRLVAGTLELGGRRVDLQRIRQPVLNIYGRQDHLVPPSASEPLGRLVGSQRLHRAGARCRPHRHVRERALAARDAAGIASWLSSR